MPDGFARISPGDGERASVVNLNIRNSYVPVVVRVGAVSVVTDQLPAYGGVYDVTPDAAADIVLPTEGKRMEKDIVVEKIPRYETTNTAGGITVIIGGADDAE